MAQRTKEAVALEVSRVLREELTPEVLDRLQDDLELSSFLRRIRDNCARLRPKSAGSKQRSFG